MQQQIVLPSYSAWFSLDSIHEIEQRSLPEFFDESSTDGSYKTASVYKEYRDFMIHTYRMNPSEYLSLTTCRRHLVGDAGSILRVHSFLDQWGLINYQITNESSRMPPNLAHKPKVTYECPKGMVGFAKSTADISITNISSTSYSFPDNSDLRVVGGDKNELKDNATANKPNCCTCGVLLKGERYHCLKDTSINVCKGCFMEGRFSSSLYSGDFVKLNETDLSDANEKWTDEEVLLLLEGIEMYKEDWGKVAEHVGTRSSVQCIAQFLRLPIFEAISKTGENEPLGAGFLGDNPVLSTVTFLASLVHPKVAAAAASAAISEANKQTLLDESECKPDAHLSTEQLNSIAATSLGIAAVKASEIAENEHRTIQQLLYSLIELVLKKIDLKLGQFDELEKQLMQERHEIDAQRNSVLLERLQLRKTAALLQTNEQVKPTGTDSDQQPQVISVENPIYTTL